MKEGSLGFLRCLMRSWIFGVIRSLGRCYLRCLQCTPTVVYCSCSFSYECGMTEEMGGKGLAVSQGCFLGWRCVLKG